MYDFLGGEVLLIDKPLHWTSFDVVKKLKALLRHQLKVKKIKIGHAGTLDPLASGLLVVCTGKKTKTIPEIQAQEKTYTGVIELGATTPSFDLETEVEFQSEVDHLSDEDLIAAANKLSGEILQTPPVFSAKKINGKRAYEMARKGERPEMKAKQVTIHAFNLTEVNLPEVKFEIRCSKGTYIRSMAHDFGEILKVGGYLKALRRTQIGDYSVEAAKSIDEIEAEIKALAVNQSAS